MELRLIYGRAGTGKTSFCFKEIAEILEKEDKIFIITPEQFSFSAEQHLMSEVKTKAVINAEVLTFNRMAFRIISEIQGNYKKSLTESGKAILLYNVLDKQKEKLTFLGKTSKNMDTISRAISELKKHSITEESLEKTQKTLEDKYLQAKLNDVLILYKEFNKLISENYIDENDLLTILYNNIDKTSIFNNSIIYIDEFSGFTKQELLIIEKLMQMAKKVNISVCTDNLLNNSNPDIDVFYPNKIAVNKILDIAKKNNITIQKNIELKNTFRFKNDELSFLEQNMYSKSFKNYNQENENIKVFLAINPYSEIEYVAKNIITLVKNSNYRYKDISVITNDLDNYSNLISVIFEQYDIPVFIDESKNLNQNPLIKYVISILDIFARGWSQESIINYAKTGFINLSKEEIFKFQSYCNLWNIRGYKKYSNDFDMGNLKEIEYNELNKIRKQIVSPLIKLKNNIDTDKTIEKITKEIYNFLIENNIDQILEEKANMLENNGQVELSNTYRTSWNVLIDIFDELVSILKGEKVSFEKYSDLLKVGLNSTSLGKIPATLDEVIVGNIDRSRSSKKKVVFIIGLNDGKFPSINKNEGFIDDSERELLKTKGIELAKTVQEQIYDENFNIYKAFTTAEEKLFLTYSSSDINGKGLRKSNLLNKINRLFPNLKEDSDIVEEKIYISNKKAVFNEMLLKLREIVDGKDIDKIWIELFNIFLNDEEYKEKLANSIEGMYYNNIAQDIQVENIEKIYGNEIKTSISKLETYRRCPFSFFVKYILKLSDRTDYKIETLDTGNFMHEVIDEFFEYINDNSLDIKLIEETKIKEILNFIVNEKLSNNKNYIFTSSPKYVVLTNRLKKVLFTSIKYIITTIKNSDFKIFGNEVEFGTGKQYEPIEIKLDNKRKIEIIGKIDRVDIAENEEGKFIRIIDYKSSIKNIDLNQVMAGIQIQLLTYLDAITENEKVEPAGILYFNLIEPVIKSKNKNMTSEELEQEIKSNFKMNGIVLGDVKVVKMMDNTLKSGKSELLPVYIEKEGNISKSKSNSLDKNEFRMLQKQVKSILKQITKEILDGNIKQKPVYISKTKQSSCEYCKYKSICQFNPNMCGNNYNYVPNLKKDEIIEKLKE